MPFDIAASAVEFRRGDANVRLWLTAVHSCKRIRWDAYTDTERPPVSRLQLCIDNNVKEICRCFI